MKKRDIKRIDCVGNANNYVLLICRALRDLGYDAHLHLTMGTERDHPEALYPEYADGYPEWIHDWRVNKKHIYLSQDIVHRHRLCFALRNTDALLLNYDNIALGSLIDKPTVCILTGTDLYNFANIEDFREKHKFGNPFEDKKRIIHMLMQRSAIRNACAFTCFPKGILPEGDKILSSIGVNEERRISFLISDTQSLNYSSPPMWEEMKILYAARVSWNIGKGDCTPLDDKGTNIFLRAFAHFIQSGGKARLTLFRAGARVVEAEALIAALGIESWVDWREHTPQAEFNMLMKDADLIVDQTGTSHIGMAVLDAMALGRPVIASAPDNSLWKIEEKFPICHATTEEQICKWLWKLSLDTSLREEFGKKNRFFVEKFFDSKKNVHKILQALHAYTQNNEEFWLWQQYDQAVFQEFQYIQRMNRQ